MFLLKDFPENFWKDIFGKLLEYVGADKETFDFGRENWFWDYEWTPEKEDSYQKWLINYIKSHKREARIFGNVNTYSNKSIAQWAKMFLLAYGWKYPKGVYE